MTCLASPRYWVIAFILFSYLGVFAYLITQGGYGRTQSSASQRGQS